MSSKNKKFSRYLSLLLAVSSLDATKLLAPSSFAMNLEDEDEDEEEYGNGNEDDGNFDIELDGIDFLKNWEDGVDKNIKLICLGDNYEKNNNILRFLKNANLPSGYKVDSGWLYYNNDYPLLNSEVSEVSSLSGGKRSKIMIAFVNELNDDILKKRNDIFSTYARHGREICECGDGFLVLHYISKGDTSLFDYDFSSICDPIREAFKNYSESDSSESNSSKIKKPQPSSPDQNKDPSNPAPAKKKPSNDDKSTSSNNTFYIGGGVLGAALLAALGFKTLNKQTKKPISSSEPTNPNIPDIPDVPEILEPLPDVPEKSEDSKDVDTDIPDIDIDDEFFEKDDTFLL